MIARNTKRRSPLVLISLVNIISLIGHSPGIGSILCLFLLRCNVPFWPFSFFVGTSSTIMVQCPKEDYSRNDA